VIVAVGDAQWVFALRAIGYGDALAPVPAAQLHASANRVEYARGTLTEWYVNSPFGVQQGFTVERAPDLTGFQNLSGLDAPLTLALAFSGAAQVSDDGCALTLLRPDGTTALRYAGLMAYDATGRELPAWLDLSPRPPSLPGKGENLPSPLRRGAGGEVLLRVDDRGAQYPLTIDPFFEKAKLTASDGAANDYFGYAVAISGDTVVVGAYGDDSSKGAAYVFVKPDGGWATTSTYNAKLTASDGVANDYFSHFVSISGDTVVAGAYQDDSNRGSAYVFVKPVGGWSGNLTQTAKLTASDGVAGDQFGYWGAISGDTVAVAAWKDDVTYTDQGSAYVFVQLGGGWATCPVVSGIPTCNQTQ